MKAVDESLEKPLMYYKINLVSTMVLAEACLKLMLDDLSLLLWCMGTSGTFVETMVLLRTTNPHVETKAISERILKVNPGFTVTLLSYLIELVRMRVV